jgi:hypothetical protein
VEHKDWLVQSPHLKTFAIDAHVKSRVQFCESALERTLTADEIAILENTVWNTVNYILERR